ncbi:uncharacterized protein HD556DRAFT_1371350 [Suillus plorans]|uniref:Tc1-like transposase DDE domain-containing protein n=1 Tax=Suillus plorans TaxID=116603 RepID=A0A9P7DII0_9AGAM|nr:uncharacterized protein HD556DRAFT_1371350 [Suillus plorans]KAG1794159.1 hypothetical protein HD556DRAFT_1371350 [Suillus plorans]
MGRLRLLDQIMKNEICGLLAETPSLLLNEIGEWLAIYHDQPISTPALYCNLGNLGLAYERLKRIAAERDDGFRADWLHNTTANYTAEQLMFLDESSPNMNPFPGPSNVIVLDNCPTHKSDALREAVGASGLLNANKIAAGTVLHVARTLFGESLANTFDCRFDALDHG